MNIEKMIKAAQMQELPELVLKNCRIVNVFTGEIVSGDIAVSEGYIVGVGDYDGIKNVDVGGKYVLPGFVNSHVHVESSAAQPDKKRDFLLSGCVFVFRRPPMRIRRSGGPIFGPSLRLNPKGSRSS